MNDIKSGSNLEKVLKSGHFAFTGKCGPPKGANVHHLKEKIAFLKGNVDAVNITDNQTAVVRMSSWAASALSIQEGVEPNFQMVCRYRNRLAMMSDILGVYALGVRNMLCLYHPAAARRRQGKSRRRRYQDRHRADRGVQGDEWCCRRASHGH
jgi:methylenetetrahydrofolate reductase (NADPH)